MSRRTPFIALGFLLLLVTCRDGTEPQLQLARVAVAPVLPSERALASFGLTLDPAGRLWFTAGGSSANYIGEMAP